MAKLKSVFALCGLGVVACGGTQARTAAPTEPAAAAHELATPRSNVASRPARAHTMDDTHRLVIESVACWSGNLWGDAEGVAPSDRAADNQRRCEQVIQHAYGVNDTERAERLRAIDPTLVTDLKLLVIDTAKPGSIERPRTQQLGMFLEAAAEAEREAAAIRETSSHVQADIPGTTDPARLTKDEASAVRPLNDARSFETLLSLDMGSLTPEARAIAMLCAVDRMQAVRNLSDHLKVYALERPFTDLFNTTTPVAPADIRQPLESGVWFAYINAVAGAAGHAVSDAAESGLARESLAWAGVLEGLGDKLHAEAEQMSDTTDLKRVVDGAVKRIDGDYRATETSILHHPG
ncbi:MAG TPA: hypothetical protein VHW01_27305 [Polyangiaceae bacterium]|nr:hypothetical protein [Polyangiaceae bacterium]